MKTTQIDFEQTNYRAPMTQDRALKEVILKSLDVLLLAAQSLSILTGSVKVTGIFKGAETQNTQPSPGATYIKKTTCWLETGEDREVTETYQLNEDGRWELVDVKIEDSR